MTAGNAFGRRTLRIAAIVAGGVLALFFWNLEFLWFQGGPIGLVLVAVALLDVVESRSARSSGGRRGIVEELRAEIFGSTDRADTPSEREDRS